MIGSIFSRLKHKNPIAVGAVGGSGTRIVTQFLSDAGYYIGSDLNEANDNLWFTFLFKRREILIEPRQTFERMATMFFRRMQGSSHSRINCADVEMLQALTSAQHSQYAPDWLQERTQTFLNATSGAHRTHGYWAWKEPNTHVVIDKLLELNAGLRYIHVVRNGLDMAYSENQNQLQLWGPVFLGHDVRPTPRFSLSYWCAVHRRIKAIAERIPSRVMFLDFDGFCRDPRKGCDDILTFCGRSVPQSVIDDFVTKVRIPESSGRFHSKSIVDLDPEDIEYVSRWGYSIT
jgi:hypothetical protein